MERPAATPLNKFFCQVTLEVKAMKHTPAKSNNSKPMKLRKPNYARHRAYRDDEQQQRIDDA